MYNARTLSNRRYKQKTKQKQVEYSISEMEEYRKIEEHLAVLNISYQKYVKQLIRKDMETW